MVLESMGRTNQADERCDMNKRIIIQHWAGEIPPIVLLSIASMRAYAAQIGAEYRLLTGLCFEPRLSPPCQKIAMLQPEFDAYEDVAMVDADMLARKGLEEDLFTVPGYGIYHPEAHRRILRNVPRLPSSVHAFWGGAVYRFPRDLRIRLREQYVFEEALPFNCRGNGVDEGIMHRLAVRADIGHTRDSYFGQEWAWASYDEHPERGKFIHIRHHDGKGHRCDKMDVYRDLQQRGVFP